MSACISSHGEYSSHENDEFHTCKWCGVFDEGQVLAELGTANAKLERVEALHRRKRHQESDRSYTFICSGCMSYWPCRTAAALGLTAEQEGERNE